MDARARTAFALFLSATLGFMGHATFFAPRQEGINSALVAHLQKQVVNLQTQADNSALIADLQKQVANLQTQADSDGPKGTSTPVNNEPSKPRRATLAAPKHPERKFGHIDMWKRMEQLRDFGFNPEHILDIGANRGTWSAQAHRIWPTAKIFMLEANPAHDGVLKATGFPHAIAVLGDASRAVTMHFGRNNMDTGNSIFQETTNLELYEPSTVQMRTLDDVLAANQMDATSFQLMKIDVQGAELMVLSAAAKTLESVEVILLELSVVNFNAGAPLWLKVQAELDRLGFHIFDVCELHYKPEIGTLIQVDLMFVRGSSTLWDESTTGYPKPNWGGS